MPHLFGMLHSKPLQATQSRWGSKSRDDILVLQSEQVLILLDDDDESDILHKSREVQTRNPKQAKVEVIQ